MTNNVMSCIYCGAFPDEPLNFVCEDCYKKEEEM